MTDTVRDLATHAKPAGFSVDEKDKKREEQEKRSGEFRKDGRRDIGVTRDSSGLSVEVTTNN